MKKFNTIVDFLNFFDDEETCIQYLEALRFRDGDFCPHCSHEKIYRFIDCKTYKCAKCKKKFTIRTGTIFESSKIPFQTWFLAIYLLSTSKKGISSIQLASQIGVTQKTAWFIYHRIRQTYEKDKKKLSGIIEIDETYVGGKGKNKHLSKKRKGTQGRSLKSKMVIIGIADREGNFLAKNIKSTKRKIIKSFLKENTTNISELISDEYRAYDTIATSRVNHSRKVYVIGHIHTNSVESFWALFKRGYTGIYHYMSKKHLQRFIDEFVYRLNNKKLSNFKIVKMSLLNIEGHLSYKDLIKND